MEKSFQIPYFNNDSRPVANITWYDAVAYCNELSKEQELKPYYSITSIKKI